MLKYVGGGYIPDVPAKNLTDEQVKALPVTKKRLLDSGFYVEEKPPKTEKKESGESKESPEKESGEGS